MSEANKAASRRLYEEVLSCPAGTQAVALTVSDDGGRDLLPIT